MRPVETLRAIVADNRAGRLRGIPSWCTAHPETLRAVLQSYRDDGDAILIEATCNQVNHRGGYTGMTPAAFRAFIVRLAGEAGVDPSRILLGGDHLGPNPWKARPAAEAMDEARVMTRAYVEAGFDKIHLDASMSCADDRLLSESEMAARAAELCAVAEAERGEREVVYVVGTEVPIPGGETEWLDTLAVTRPEAARRTWELHREAFAARGLGAAMERVIAIVVQPGVDMGNSQVFAFEKAKAGALSAAVLNLPGVVYEAHSTDYQTESALAELVAAHFPILKVGPALTFAYREAVVAMAAIEDRMNFPVPSRIVEVLREAMDANDVYWRAYIAADDQRELMKIYGLSDRVRYYWPDPKVEAALATLTANVNSVNVPLGLISQFIGAMPPPDPVETFARRAVRAKAGAVVATYRRACRG